MSPSRFYLFLSSNIHEYPVYSSAVVHLPLILVRENKHKDQVNNLKLSVYFSFVSVAINKSLERDGPYTFSAQLNFTYFRN